MNFEQQLIISANEYVENIESKDISLIRIIIPDFNGSFLILRNQQLLYLDSSQSPQLCVYFSFKTKSKKSKINRSKIQESNCLNKFKVFDFEAEIVYILETKNDLFLISDVINDILETLFPNVNKDQITIEVIKHKEWTTIKEHSHVHKTST